MTEEVTSAFITPPSTETTDFNFEAIWKQLSRGEKPSEDKVKLMKAAIRGMDEKTTEAIRTQLAAIKAQLLQQTGKEKDPALAQQLLAVSNTAGAESKTRTKKKEILKGKNKEDILEIAFKNAWQNKKNGLYNIPITGVYVYFFNTGTKAHIKVNAKFEHRSVHFGIYFTNKQHGMDIDKVTFEIPPFGDNKEEIENKIRIVTNQIVQEAKTYLANFTFRKEKNAEIKKITIDENNDLQVEFKTDDEEEEVIEPISQKTVNPIQRFGMDREVSEQMQKNAAPYIERNFENNYRKKNEKPFEMQDFLELNERIGRGDETITDAEFDKFEAFCRQTLENIQRELKIKKPENRKTSRKARKE